MSTLSFSLNCFKCASKLWPKIRLQRKNHSIKRNQTNHESKHNSNDKHDSITLSLTNKSLDKINYSRIIKDSTTNQLFNENLRGKGNKDILQPRASNHLKTELTLKISH